WEPHEFPRDRPIRRTHPSPPSYPGTVAACRSPSGWAPLVSPETGGARQDGAHTDHLGAEMVPSHEAVTVFFTGSISMITTPLPVASANRPRPQVMVKAPSLRSMPGVDEGWSSPLKVREMASPLGPLNAPMPSVQEIGTSPLRW